VSTGDDLAAVFEAAVANELMQDSWVETLYDVSEKVARPSLIT
jgi:hypothetical protein